MTQADKAALEQKLREAITKIDEVKATLENAEIEPEPKATGWAGNVCGSKYVTLWGDGGWVVEDDTGCVGDKHVHSIANKFTNDEAGRAKAEEVAAVQLCYRLLKRFSDENGGEQIDWNDSRVKWFIHTGDGGCLSPWGIRTKQLGRVYFCSKEIAQQAIDHFRPQIMAAMGIKGAK